MKLLPNSFKKWGYVLLVLSFVLWIAALLSHGELAFLQTQFFTAIHRFPLSDDVYFGISEVNLTFTLIGILFIIGALLVGFSREKNEDEYIQQIRLSSLQWAVLINYTVLLLTFILVFGSDFLSVMAYNMFTTLILFIVRFEYLLRKNLA